MTTKVFAVYDTKGLVYGPPSFALTTGSAIRSFGDLANDKQTTISRHPSDYILMEIGVYDDQTGIIKSYETPKNLGFASDYVQLPMTLKNDDLPELPLKLNGKGVPIEVQK